MKKKIRHKLTEVFRDRYEAEKYLRDNIELMLDFFKKKNVKTIDQLKYDMYAEYLQKTFLAKEKLKEHKTLKSVSKLYENRYLKRREMYWNVLTAIEIVDLFKVKKDEEVDPLLHNPALVDGKTIALLVDLQIKQERRRNRQLKKAGRARGYTFLYENCKLTREIDREHI